MARRYWRQIGPVPALVTSSSEVRLVEPPALASAEAAVPPLSGLLAIRLYCHQGPPTGSAGAGTPQTSLEPTVTGTAKRFRDPVSTWPGSDVRGSGHPGICRDAQERRLPRSPSVSCRTASRCCAGLRRTQRSDRLRRVSPGELKAPASDNNVTVTELSLGPGGGPEPNWMSARAHLDPIWVADKKRNGETCPRSTRSF